MEKFLGNKNCSPESHFNLGTCFPQVLDQILLLSGVDPDHTQQQVAGSSQGHFDLRKHNKANTVDQEIFIGKILCWQNFHLALFSSL